MSNNYDVIVIGAGAAGLMCAAQAGKRGRRVLLLEHNERIGQKILISGGGRCNFTNLYTEPGNYLSENEHFCKSALSRYTQWDFIKLVEDYGVPYHEKTLGQQFCDSSAEDIVDLLEKECHKGDVRIATQCAVTDVAYADKVYRLQTSKGEYLCESLVIATGALSFPRLGATDFGHQIAEQFGLQLTPLSAGLVPFTFERAMRKDYEELSGISLEVIASCNDQSFREAMLFTHKGLSGPAILQISSYWQPGQSVELNLLPDLDFTAFMQEQKQQRPKVQIKTVLNEILPKRFVELLCTQQELQETQLGNLSALQLEQLTSAVQPWTIVPAGTEGYRKAEVTLGGVDTNELSSKTMESKRQSGLYFIGEVIDVTGHLGGFNFQWAWASGYCAGQYV